MAEPCTSVHGRGCGGERRGSGAVLIFLKFNVFIVNFKCCYEL